MPECAKGEEDREGNTKEGPEGEERKIRKRKKRERKGRHQTRRSTVAFMNAQGRYDS